MKQTKICEFFQKSVILGQEACDFCCRHHKIATADEQCDSQTFGSPSVKNTKITDFI